MAARMTDDQFESAVAGALDSLPDFLAEAMDNVAVIVADEPDDGDLAGDGHYAEGGELLGLYDGVSLAERGEWYGAGDEWPDTITIFKGPHERTGDDLGEVLEEVRRTVIHEVAHHFGMDERQVSDMGYA